MDLLAVLVGHNGALGGARIGAQNHAVLVDDADNGGAGLDGLGRAEALAGQHGITVFIVGGGVQINSLLLLRRRFCRLGSLVTVQKTGEPI